MLEHQRLLSDKLLTRRDFLRLSALTGGQLALVTSGINFEATSASPSNVYSYRLLSTFPRNALLGVKSLIQSRIGQRGNFEAVVLEKNNLVHYWHNNNNTNIIDPNDHNIDTPWIRGLPITSAASGPGSIIQNNSNSNFEVAVVEGNNLVHYWYNGTIWSRGQIITTNATGPGCLIHSSFGTGVYGNFEVLALEGNDLVHYWHDNSDLSTPWLRGKIITTKATGPGCLIQSNFGTGTHGNFEVLVLEGHDLVHYWHDNSDLTTPWLRGQIITTAASGPGSIIQSDVINGGHGNFEVVVLEGSNLVHYWRDNSNMNNPWQRGQIITTAASGPGCIIQSNLGAGQSKDFEVIVQECNQSVIHYWYSNENSGSPWLRWLRSFFHILEEDWPGTMPWTRKVVQLTGEWDLEIGQHAYNQTEKNYGIIGTDLGSSFVHSDGRVYFLFGDTFRQKMSQCSDVNDNLDSIAFSTDRYAYDGLHLTFDAQPPHVFTIDQGTMNVPLDGVSINNVMYVCFSTDHHTFTTTDGQALRKLDLMGRTVLARSFDKGLKFEVLYTFSVDKFINVSVQRSEMRRTDDLPNLGEALFIWGSGRYRASDLYLAYMPLAQIENKSSLLYFAGIHEGQVVPQWSSAEEAAVPLFRAGCIGEFSVRWNSYLNRWILLYNSDNPVGIVLRMAEQPWGPWSDARIIFNPSDGHHHFVHKPEKNANGMQVDQVYDSMFGCDRSEEWGYAYGPYQIAPYATGVTNKYSKIYFALSTWNPYQVMQMSAVITIEGQDLDPRAYAYNIFSPNSQKFARISVLLAQIAFDRQLNWNLIRQSSLCSADYIEWAKFQTVNNLRSELKSKFRQLIVQVDKSDVKADIYATITIDLMVLGAKGSQDLSGYNAYKVWALQAIQAGHSEWLANEMDIRIDSEQLLSSKAHDRQVI